MAPALRTHHVVDMRRVLIFRRVSALWSSLVSAAARAGARGDKTGRGPVDVDTGSASVPWMAPTRSSKRSWTSSRDATTLLALFAVLTVVIGQRWQFDAWLTEFDRLTQYLPWYAYMGERLRAFQIPGWNPYQFSGTPFAGDPQSGWMYIPAMLSFALLPPIPAFKVLVGIQIVVAALATYALARLLQMAPPSALAAATAYACGPFLGWSTGGITIMAQLAPWIPLSLLGGELALSARTWLRRLAGWSVGAVAVSQMLAGWLGQGAMYGLLAMAAYIGYRGLLAPTIPRRPWRERVWATITSGIALFGFGLALGAAGLLPRLAVNGESTLAGGNYRNLGAAGVTYPPMDPTTLVFRVLADNEPNRSMVWGGAVIVLALLAPVLAGRRYAVPYFAGLTLTGLTLTQAPTPLHRLLYLMPGFAELHEHAPALAFVLVPIGTALLSGATVEVVSCCADRPPRLWWLWLPVVGLLLAATAAIVSRQIEFVGWRSLTVAALTLLILAIAFTLRSRPRVESKRTTVMAVLLIGLIVVQPTGLEITGSWLGWPPSPSWVSLWASDPAREAALTANIDRQDRDGAGTFLQRQLAESGPFRYVGYGGFGYPGDEARRRSYMTRRFDPYVTAILVNGRPLFLGLSEIQGYNPSQLSRYREFINALNGQEPNYHIAYLLPSGTASPLLRLLDVRYVVIDASLPENRDDVLNLKSGLDLVFYNDLVSVYEDPTATRAWIVHEVQQVQRGEALPLLAQGSVDPFHTALVEGEVPLVKPSTGPESARVTQDNPEAISVAVTATAPGLLVVSEIYAQGWQAFVDGTPAPILPTDHVLRGIPIPAGSHWVELRYNLAALEVGCLISGLAWGALLLLGVSCTLWRGQPRRTKRYGGESPAVVQSTLLRVRAPLRRVSLRNVLCLSSRRSAAKRSLGG